MLNESKFRNRRKQVAKLANHFDRYAAGELDRKSEQLAVKDKQIEELNARLAEVSSALVTAQQTAAAAQALHAGTMHQQLLSGKSGADQPERETEPVQKRSWFSRFFGD